MFSFVAGSKGRAGGSRGKVVGKTSAVSDPWSSPLSQIREDLCRSLREQKSRRQQCLWPKQGPSAGPCCWCHQHRATGFRGTRESWGVREALGLSHVLEEQVSFLPPGSTETCPFVEGRSLPRLGLVCGYMLVTFPVPLPSSSVLHQREQEVSSSCQQDQWVPFLSAGRGFWRASAPPSSLGRTCPLLGATDRLPLTPAWVFRLCILSCALTFPNSAFL